MTSTGSYQEEEERTDKIWKQLEEVIPSLKLLGEGKKRRARQIIAWHLNAALLERKKP